MSSTCDSRGWKASLLIVGSEMLDPHRRDANGPPAREALREIGIELTSIVRAADDIAVLRETLRSCAACCRLVLVSGGLGPTGDDLTRDALASLLSRGIHEDADWVRELEARLASRGKELDLLGRRQAHLVDGAEALPNGAGLACGNWLEADGTIYVLLPGVPREFKDIFERHVVPRLRERIPNPPLARILRYTLAGIPEVEAERTLRPWYGREGIDLSILPSLGVLSVAFTLSSPPLSDPESLENDIRKSMEDGLSRRIVSSAGESVSEVLGKRLLERGWTVSAAESCSGGLLSQKIVAVPGASGYHLGSITAYANEAKRELLGVPPGTLERFGAVSEETALAMIRGARARFNSHCAVSTTGVAGPTGGTQEKPVGTVWIAAGTPERETARKIFLPLDRRSIMEFAANTALYLLWRLVTETEK